MKKLNYQEFKDLLRKSLDKNEPLCITFQLTDSNKDREISKLINFVKQFIFDENILGSIKYSKSLAKSLMGSDVIILTFTYVSDEQ